MNSKFNTLFSFFIYGVGLLAFLLADLFVIQYFSKENIAEWAFTKSIIAIVGSLCLLGYDQVFIRDTSLIQRFFKQFNIQALFILLILGFFLFFIMNYELVKIGLILTCTYTFALLSYFAASYRAYFNLWKAQLATNLWKIILLATLLLCTFKIVSFFFFIALFIALVVVVVVFKGFKLHTRKNDNILLDNNTARHIGYSFVLSNITLIFAVYGEQFLVNLNNDIEVSSHLFSYFAIFTPIALSLNGFLGFYFGPKIRKDNNMSVKRYKVFSMSIFGYSVLITTVSTVVGVLYKSFYLKENIIDLDFSLIASLFVLCIVRGLYISTSVCLGVFGDAKSLKRAALLMCASSTFYIVLVFFILSSVSGIVAAQLIAIASVVNWVLRLLISNFFTFRNLRRINNKV